VSDPGPAPAPIGEAHRYPCPQCGADTRFDPARGALACEHCGAQVAIEHGAGPIREHDYRAALVATETRPVSAIAPGGREVECTTCGARVIVAGHADRCAFCDSALVVEIAAEETIPPESLLPFAVDRARAGAAFSTWLGKRWFAPSDLVARAKKDALDGVYLPYWTFDSRTTTRYRGARGDHYYVTERYTDSQGTSRTRQVQKTRWRSASGTVRVDFDDVLVPASAGLPPKVIAGLEPWDLPALVPFDGRYLAGFVAERYRVGLEDGFRGAEARMEPRIEAAIRGDIGGDVQRIDSMSVAHDDVRWKHLLLPVWVSSFRYRERLFRVTVNARTGEVSGERPWSWIKIGLLVLAIVLLAVGGYLAWAAQAPDRGEWEQSRAPAAVPGTYVSARSDRADVPRPGAAGRCPRVPLAPGVAKG
jgi:DNA-directed RNA polymerase subunit RPC12/RpoP